MFLSPWRGEAPEAGSLSSGPQSVVAWLCDLGQPPPAPTLCRVYSCIQNGWPFKISVTLLRKDALESCCSPGHREGVLNCDWLSVALNQ